MCSISINEKPDRESGRVFCCVGGGGVEWNPFCFQLDGYSFEWGEGGGIWFQLSANPISHFIDLRGYCGVHAEKMKDVLFPNCESAGKSVIHWN